LILILPTSLSRYDFIYSGTIAPDQSAALIIMKSLSLRLLCLLSVVFGLCAAHADDKPNIVLIYADDLGYADIGCFGGSIPTPHIDRLAREGVRFTDFYVAQAVCSASRTALLTGCLPNRIGILGALGPNSNNGINAAETTLAEGLKSKGYATAIFGKWHLGHHPEFLPTNHGFDEYYGLPYSNDMWPRHPSAKPGAYPALPLVEGLSVIARNPDQSLLTNSYTDHAISFINRHKPEPFFVYLPHSMPHVPLFVSKEGDGATGKGLHADVIAEIDRGIGRILDTLKANGLDENTLVIFTSDNGPWLTYGDHAGSAKPLREGKGTSFDGGVRVPFVARWPKKIKPGAVISQPAMTIDMLPTIMSIVDNAWQPPKDRPIDGLDIRPMLFGDTSVKTPHEAFYFYWGNELQAVRVGDWKLHFPHDYQSIEGRPRATGGKPVGYTKSRTGLALYNLRNDIGETTNLIDKEEAVAELLKVEADEIRALLGDTNTGQKGTAVREPGRHQPESAK
jgi:arylsulfatase A-like enzyme